MGTMVDMLLHIFTDEELPFQERAIISRGLAILLARRTGRDSVSHNFIMAECYRNFHLLLHMEGAYS